MAIDLSRGRVIDLDSGDYEEMPPPTTYTGGRAIDLESGNYVNEEQAALVDRLFEIEEEEIRRRTRKENAASINEDIGDIEQFIIGSGRGFTNLGRALGLAGKESKITRDALEDLNEGEIIGTAGEVFGEAGPFMGPAMLANLARTTTGKVLTGGAVGATEGAIVTKGRGGDISDTFGGAGLGGIIAGGMELLGGTIGRLGNAIYNRLGRTPKGPLLTANNEPTEEFSLALEEAGTSFEELSDVAKDYVSKAATDPVQAARQARFDSQNIRASAGDITQNYKQQGTEQKLLVSASDDARPFQLFKLGQSQDFEREAFSLINQLGLSDDAGNAIKSALVGSKQSMKDRKNALYKSMVDAAPEVRNTPIFTTDIRTAIPDQKILKDLEITSSGGMKQFHDALVQYGVIKDKDVVERYLSGPADAFGNKREITPLNVENYDQFRKLLNRIERSDETGAMSVAIGPVKNALDGEADFINKALKEAGVEDATVFENLGQARNIVREMKEEFSPQSMAGRLIDTKRDGVTDVIEASQAVPKLLAKGTPVEDVAKVVRLLKNSDGGKRALGNLQAAVVFRALEDSLSATGRKIDGQSVFSGDKFSKSLEKVGEDKLSVIFDGNTSGLKRLLNLRQTGLDIQPPSKAVPVGSAPIIIEIMQKINSLGNVPGLAHIRDIFRFVMDAGAEGRKVSESMASQKLLTDFLESYPKFSKLLDLGSKAPVAGAVSFGVPKPESQEADYTFDEESGLLF